MRKTLYCFTGSNVSKRNPFCQSGQVIGVAMPSSPYNLYGINFPYRARLEVTFRFYGPNAESTGFDRQCTL
jgi:hypothetical protein